MSPSLSPHARGGLPQLRLVLGGAAGATMLTLLHLPAGALIGAVVGSAAANRIRVGGPPAVLPAAGAVIGLVLLGGVAGARLDTGSLTTLGRAAVPMAAAFLVLLLANVGLAAVLFRRFGIDRLTAVLACAPGGVTDIAVTAQALGARTEIVFAVHAVRVLAVVLVVLPVLVVVLDGG